VQVSRRWFARILLVGGSSAAMLLGGGLLLFSPLSPLLSLSTSVAFLGVFILLTGAGSPLRLTGRFLRRGLLRLLFRNRTRWRFPKKATREAPRIGRF